MAIDASIYKAFAQPVKSVADYDNEALQQKQNQLALSLGQQKADEYTRGIADQNNLRQVVSGFGQDTGANQLALLNAGRLKEAQDYAKSNADLGKTAAETKHVDSQTQGENLKALNQSFTIHRDQINMVNDPASAAQWVKAGFQDPLMAPILSRIGSEDQAISKIPQDPAGFAQWKMQAGLASNEYVKHTTPDANAVLSAKTQTENSLRSAASSKYSADSSAASARARLNYDQQQPKGQIVQTDNGPVLVDPRTGKGVEVTGPDGVRLAGVTKPLNDSQSKALLFASRMQEADKVLGSLGDAGTSVSVPGSRAPFIGGVVNAMSGQKNQSLNQAKTDFMTALLRRESGAAIGQGEFDTADKQYFPQVGDGPDIIAQKARNRQIAINGIMAEVPERQRASITPQSSASVAAKPKASPATNAQGWALHTDAKGNRAYVSPDGKQFQEVH